MYLLDTNALLYFLYECGKRSPKAAEGIFGNNKK